MNKQQFEDKHQVTVEKSIRVDGRFCLTWKAVGNYQTLAITNRRFDNDEECIDALRDATKIAFLAETYLDRRGKHRWRFPSTAYGPGFVRVS